LRRKAGDLPAGGAFGGSGRFREVAWVAAQVFADDAGAGEVEPLRRLVDGDPVVGVAVVQCRGTGDSAFLAFSPVAHIQHRQVIADLVEALDRETILGLDQVPQLVGEPVSRVEVSDHRVDTDPGQPQGGFPRTPVGRDDDDLVTVPEHHAGCFRETPVETDVDRSAQVPGRERLRIARVEEAYTAGEGVAKSRTGQFVNGDLRVEDRAPLRAQPDRGRNVTAGPRETDGHVAVGSIVSSARLHDTQVHHQVVVSKAAIAQSCIFPEWYSNGRAPERWTVCTRARRMTWSPPS
jgi:hypothetical protein